MKFFLMQQNGLQRVIDVADIAEAWEATAGKTSLRLKSQASAVLYDTTFSSFKTALQNNETVITV